MKDTIRRPRENAIAAAGGVSWGTLETQVKIKSELKMCRAVVMDGEQNEHWLVLWRTRHLCKKRRSETDKLVNYGGYGKIV